MASAPLTPVSPGAFAATSIRKQAEEGKHYLKMLVYGGQGAGKTTLLCSSVDVSSMGDVLLVTIEGGLIVLEDNKRITHAEDIDIIKIERIEQFQKVYEWLKIHVALRDQAGADERLKAHQLLIGLEGDRIRRFRTIVVDSLSEVEAMNLAKILNLDALGLDAGDDMEVAGFPQFRKNNHIMQRIVRQFRDLPVHFLATCAQAYSQDERKVFHYAPKLTGQLVGIIQGFFDVVGWLVPNSNAIDEKTGTAKRLLFVQPQTQPRADAKCRLASYEKAFFDNPTMSDIMAQTGIINDVV